jgi:hypothetical protein
VRRSGYGSRVKLAVALVLLACGSAAAKPDPNLAKLAPPLHDQYVAWLARQSPRDRAAAQRTVDRWKCPDDARLPCPDRVPNDAEYAELEIARLVVDPHVDVEVWMASEDSALALEAAGFHLWSSSHVPKIQPATAVALHRTVYWIHIMPSDLHALAKLLANPDVISIRRTTLQQVEHRHDEPL